MDSHHSRLSRRAGGRLPTARVARGFSVPTIAALLAVIGFAAAGIWQLARAEEKRALYASFAAGSESVNALADVLAAAGRGEDVRFRRVSVSGRYDGARQVLLEGMLNQGRVGYHVLTPLLAGEGTPVLMVDRGWIPHERDAATPTMLEVDARRRDVRGRIDRLPAPGVRLGPPAQAGGSWPRRMLYPERQDLVEALGHPVRDYRILLDPQAPDGFVRNWRPAAFGPERHLAYAVQWFALALTVVIVYAVLRRRGARAPNDGA